MKTKLNIEPILNYTNRGENGLGRLDVVKGHQHCVCHEYSITGDAPKQYVRIYEYGDGRKAKVSSWPLYIAKVGHKWYPNESITEHLLTRLGQELQVMMAYSRLVMARGQLRFCSRFFLTDTSDQELIHGADIYTGFLNGDRDFVEEIEKKQMARKFFSIQFTELAIKHVFPDDFPHIMQGLVQMVLFDCLVGNNDRHFYNWAIVRSITGKHPSFFAPVYDTARALFWNTSEDSLNEIATTRDKNRKAAFIAKYARESKPKIGLEGKEDLTHFDLLEFFWNNSAYLSKAEIAAFFDDSILLIFEKLMKEEFSATISTNRRSFILQLLTERIAFSKTILK